MTRPSPVQTMRAPFRTVVRATVPASSELDAAGWTRLEAIVDDALEPRPASVRRQLRLFVRVLSVLAFLRHGRTFGRLDAERARALLGRLEGSRLLLFRRGVWGLRTLAFMGYYGQREEQRALGYRAAPGGWEERGGSAGPWPDRDGAGRPEAGVLVAGRGDTADPGTHTDPSAEAPGP